MTATPRTDAALYPMNGVEIVWPDFARTLETELAEAKAEAAHYMSVAQKATDDLTRLRAELKELSQAYELNRVSIDELDADRARAERAELKLEKMATALADCISTFRSDDKTTIITAERQEAWRAALLSYKPDHTFT